MLQTVISAHTKLMLSFLSIGIHFLVFASHGESDATSELLVRPIYLTNDEKEATGPPVPPKIDELVHKASHSSEASFTVRIEPAHSAGPLEGLQGHVKGLRNCADDIIAFTDSMIAVSIHREKKAILVLTRATRSHSSCQYGNNVPRSSPARHL